MKIQNAFILTLFPLFFFLFFYLACLEFRIFSLNTSMMHSFMFYFLVSLNSAVAFSPEAQGNKTEQEEWSLHLYNDSTWKVPRENSVLYVSSRSMSGIGTSQVQCFAPTPTLLLSGREEKIVMVLFKKWNLVRGKILTKTYSVDTLILSFVLSGKCWVMTVTQRKRCSLKADT